MCGREWKVDVRHELTFNIQGAIHIKADNSSHRLAEDILEIANGCTKTSRLITGYWDLDRQATNGRIKG